MNNFLIGFDSCLLNVQCLYSNSFSASERTEQSGISGTGDILPDPYNNILNLLGDQQQQQHQPTVQRLGQCRAQSGECCVYNDGSNGDIECPWSGGCLFQVCFFTW